jgi:hypothetical protein
VSTVPIAILKKKIIVLISISHYRRLEAMGDPRIISWGKGQLSRRRQNI